MPGFCLWNYTIDRENCRIMGPLCCGDFIVNSDMQINPLVYGSVGKLMVE